ncbi:MAG: chemotaxis protein CheW, partial [Nitrosopumilaceae archaeon]
MKVETVPVDSLKVITFSLVNESNKKKENYAVPIEQVREIRNFLEITSVPKAKKYVKGIMNLRGLIIPVIDIKKRLGFGEV